jgi:hypothetical protein
MQTKKRPSGVRRFGVNFMKVLIWNKIIIYFSILIVKKNAPEGEGKEVIL